MTDDNGDGTYALSHALTVAAHYAVVLFVSGVPASGGVAQTLIVEPAPANAPFCRQDNLNSSGVVRSGGTASVQVRPPAETMCFVALQCSVVVLGLKGTARTGRVGQRL